MGALNVCAHENFVATVDVNRLVSEVEATALVGLAVDVRIVCAACKEPVKFRVPEVGMTSGRPTRSLDATELRAPAWIGPDERLGADLPGFTVQVLGHEEMRERDTGDRNEGIG